MKTESSSLLPLCVSLDGPLFLTDGLVGAFCRMFKKSPWNVAALPVWLLGGRTNFQNQIVRRASPDGHGRPVNVELADFLQAEKKGGRKVVLIASGDRHAAALAQERLPVFDDVIFDGADPCPAGPAKATVLEQRFGRKNFDYVGHCAADLPVWQAARSAYVVSRDDRLVARVQEATSVTRIFAPPRASVWEWMRALRIYQWSKNLLLLLPLLCAHQWTDPARLLPVILGIVAFSLCASSVYVLNDLLDLEADRHHASKRYRPFASGKIPLVDGLVAAPVLLVLAGIMACLVGWKFAAVFGAYYSITLFYSLRLKEFALMDVLALAGLYGLRILAGGVAAAVPVSDWLIMFSLFVFLSLACAKRFAEIRSLQPGATVLKGRGYIAGDVELVGNMGIGSGYLSVLVLAMYISHPSVTALYGHPQVLWLACPLLLYWISRVWLLVYRGAMHDDPVSFALCDLQSWLMGVLLMVVGFAAGPK